MPLTFCCIAKKGRVTLLKDWYGAKVENNISLLELFNAFAAGELDELHQPLDEDEFGIFDCIHCGSTEELHLLENTYIHIVQ